MEECGVAMYCDLHGHSRKHNIFIYGCESKRGTEGCLYEQVFPLMLHKNSADKVCVCVSIEKCGMIKHTKSLILAPLQILEFCSAVHFVL